MCICTTQKYLHTNTLKHAYNAHFCTDEHIHKCTFTRIETLPQGSLLVMLWCWRHCDWLHARQVFYLLYSLCFSNKYFYKTTFLFVLGLAVLTSGSALRVHSWWAWERWQLNPSWLCATYYIIILTPKTNPWSCVIFLIQNRGVVGFEKVVMRLEYCQVWTKNRKKK